MDDILTVFYNKRTGSVKEVCSGNQSFDWFGDEAEDYEKILDYIQVDYDDYILQNLINFHVLDGKLKLKNVDVPEKYL